MTKADVERLLGPASAMLMSENPETMLSWSETPERPPKRWLNVYFGADVLVKVVHFVSPPLTMRGAPRSAGF